MNKDEDDLFSFSKNKITITNSGIQTLANNYVSNTCIKAPPDLTMELKKADIEFNTAIASSAPVERLGCSVPMVNYSTKGEGLLQTTILKKLC